MKMKIESPPRISTSLNSRPLCPSTFMEKLDSGEANLIEEIFTAFLALLNTLRRAVGVPRSVNTVSKLTVSAEKLRISDGEEVKLSEMHPTMHGRSITMNKEGSNMRNFFIIIYCIYHLKRFIREIIINFALRKQKPLLRNRKAER